MTLPGTPDPIHNNFTAGARTPRTYADYRSARRRSVWQQIGAVLLSPGAFFRALPPLGKTRQWLWVALLILLLTGVSAVQQQGGAATAESGPVAVPGAVELSGDTGGADVSARWTAALIAASGLIVTWLLQALILGEASLLAGSAPSFSQNLHIVIWASVPLGLMAALQIIYMLAGGTIGQPGLAGLVAVLPGYADLPALLRAILTALAARLTLFWLWGLALTYLGLRHALGVPRWAAAVSVGLWVGLAILAPVVMGALTGG
ncbi:MAG: hypothetical protein HPY64_14790 [Anaerolineae bacterium]|nr:hypothetical protein [Anaerolineae bacterium]